MNVCYKNCCVDGFIFSFIKLYTQQDAYNIDEVRPSWGMTPIENCIKGKAT
jgi:hypothetical protein